MNPVDEILAELSEKPESVILTGSRAEGGYDESSDVDLIIIAKDEAQSEEILSMNMPSRLRDGRPSLDLKVYTREEFSKAKYSDEHFFLWTSMKNAVVLHGNDGIKSMKLKTAKVMEILWKCVTDLDDSIQSLESNIEFTGSCYKAYGALTTLYFAEKHFLNSDTENQSKENYMKSALGSEYAVVRERYYWLVNHMRVDGNQVVSISSRVDRRFSREHYSRMKSQIEVLLSHFRTKVADIGLAIENL